MHCCTPSEKWRLRIFLLKLACQNCLDCHENWYQLGYRNCAFQYVVFEEWLFDGQILSWLVMRVIKTSMQEDLSGSSDVWIKGACFICIRFPVVQLIRVALFSRCRQSNPVCHATLSAMRRYLPCSGISNTSHFGCNGGLVYARFRFENPGLNIEKRIASDLLNGFIFSSVCA